MREGIVADAAGRGVREECGDGLFGGGGEAVGEICEGERRGLRHVELREGRGDGLGFMEGGSVDVVIVNSVVQYFPDMGYLMKVLKEALRVTGRGGHVFIGDVRSQKLEKAYQTSVEME